MLNKPAILEVTSVVTETGNSNLERHFVQFPQERLESIKLQMLQDVDQPYDEQLMRVHTAFASAMEENYRLQKRISELTTELHRQKSDAQALVSQNRSVYESEVSNLRAIKDDLVRRLGCLSSEEIERSTFSQKEKMEMDARCSLLSKEVDELRMELKGQKEKAERDADNACKNTSDLLVAKHELESERDSLKNQLRVLRTQFDILQSDLHAETQRATEALRSSTEAESRLSELTQKAQVELANLRLEARQQRSEIEKQRDEFASKCQALQQELELMASRCKQVESSATMRELEATEREASVRDKMGEKVTRLEATIQHLSDLLSTTKRALEDARANGEGTMETECSRFQMENALGRELERLKRRLLEAQGWNRELGEKLRRYIVKANQRCQTMTNGDTDADKLKQLQTENQELEEKLQTSKNEIKRLTERASRKKRVHYERVQILRESLNSQQSELEKLKAENQILRCNVPLTEYQRVKRMLADLRTRHEEYEEIILGPEHFSGLFQHSHGTQVKNLHEQNLRKRSPEAEIIQATVNRGVYDLERFGGKIDAPNEARST
ncbi:unnamed protein product [Dicrocoelium dendriticum]|nr:unnamed protein product [Dicrocoelium dendriticum]